MILIFWIIWLIMIIIGITFYFYNLVLFGLLLGIASGMGVGYLISQYEDDQKEKKDGN